ncbi:MAG: NAD(P)-dependent oxidoreductase [Marmoricola sp.]
MPNTKNTADVAILGCGNMGAAFARALLASGRKVAVWNRTASRAQALATDGAVVHESARSAAADAALTILCVGTAADAREVMGSFDTGDLSGRTVLNVTSGTPDEARDLGEWAVSQGLKYLDGVILAYPEQIGTETARILVAGDEELWQEHQECLRSLAGLSAYAGRDFAAAASVDTGLVGAFYISSLVAFVEATRFMTNAGVPPELISELLDDITTLQHQLRLILGRVTADDYSTDQATLHVYAEVAQSFSSVMGDAPIANTTARILQEGIRAGFGEEDLAALFKL